MNFNNNIVPLERRLSQWEELNIPNEETKEEPWEVPLPQGSNEDRIVENLLDDPEVQAAAVAELPAEGGEIEIWGDGEQTRSFLYIDECIEATYRLVQSDFMGPVNIGSEEMVTINQLADTAAKVAGKTITKKHIDGPLGVRGRNSNNDLIREKLGWDYSQTLEEGISKTYNWIDQQIKTRG